MKVAFATLLVIGATLSNAIAVADPSPEAARKGHKLGFCGPPGMFCARSLAACGVPGSPCARLKRSAEAVAAAFAEAADHDERGLCGAEGLSCHKARRSILDVGESIESAVDGIYTREAYASAEAAKKGPKLGFCGPPGMFCARKSKRDAEAEAARKGHKLGFCGPPGMFCAKTKRDAVAEAAKKPKMGFCGPPGMFCAKNKRDADAEAARKGHKLGFCGPPGMFCAKTKREAEAAPEAEPARKGHKLGFCGPPGMFCAKVRRDVESVTAQAHTAEEVKIARSIDALDPSFFKRVRDADDGEGTALRNAQAAFLEVKRHAEALAQEDTTPIELLQQCYDYDCDEETINTIVARAQGQFDEREAEACNAEGGACELAKRQLDEIEEKLNAAVEAL